MRVALFGTLTWGAGQAAPLAASAALQKSWRLEGYILCGLLRMQEMMMNLHLIMIYSVPGFKVLGDP